MTEERIKEIERAFGVLDPAKFPLGLHNLIRTVAVEARKEGEWQYRSLLRETKVKDKYIKELQAEIRQLKE